MEKINKQVKELRDIAENLYKHSPYSLRPVLYKAAETIESLYQKQTPKEPIWFPDCEECEKDNTTDCTMECGSFSTYPKSVLVCQSCKKHRVIKEHDHKYCQECGQAIDWTRFGISYCDKSSKML